MARLAVEHSGSCWNGRAYPYNRNNADGWKWCVWGEDGSVVAQGSLHGDSERRRKKAIKRARRIAETHKYTEDVITKGDADSMKKRISALEKELLTT